MATSDSEDFESADEGHASPTKGERKKRLSSSNYSDNLESDLDAKKPEVTSRIQSVAPKNVEPETTTDGWDDFDIDENEPVQTSNKQSKPIEQSSNKSNSETKIKAGDTKDTGWDEFDDWGEGETPAVTKEPRKPSQFKPEADIKEVTDRLAQTSTKSEGWGWGWGVDSLLSTATAGISTLTNQVSQGFTTVLESGIGAPDPEELARRTSKETDARKPSKSEESKPIEEVKPEEASKSGGDAFPFGSLLSGVTKFVETTGTKVLAGGLDTLETIGKKTMEVLQDGDPGLAKKRAMLGLDSGDKPVLSQVLREAKAVADEEDKIREAKREAKEVHYENLFDDFEGLVHLEALEMLSKQVNMRIEERLRAVDPAKRHEIKETLQQVAELCEMPEEDEDEEDDEEEPTEHSSRPDALHDRLQKATRDIGIKIHFQPLVKQYRDILDWLDATEESQTEKTIYKRAVSGLAQATALSVELYHKTAEMLLVKPRRSTADEADALTQMTVVLTKHISEMATVFTEKLNTHPAENKDQINNYITNVFLEAGNSSKYIENAFQLALPILQIGAV